MYIILHIVLEQVIVVVVSGVVEVIVLLLQITLTCGIAPQADPERHRPHSLAAATEL